MTTPSINEHDDVNTLCLKNDTDVEHYNFNEH